MPLVFRHIILCNGKNPRLYLGVDFFYSKFKNTNSELTRNFYLCATNSNLLKRTEKITLKKGTHYKVFFLILFINFATFAKSQAPTPQLPETTKPITTQPTTAPANNGQEAIYVPIVTPPTKKRRRRVVVSDSVRLAFVRDSLAKIAQNTNNTPFNINPASKPTTDSVAKPPIITVDGIPVLTNSENPFEILRGATPDTNRTKTKTILESAPSLLNKETYSRNFLFWIFLITLSLTTVVVANARSAIRDAYQALLSDNALRQIYRLRAGWENVTQMALYGLFLINLSIFIFLIYHRSVGQPPANQSWTFLFCLLGVCLVFFVKHTILFIISAVFPIAKEVKLYNFIIMTGGILLGLILFPLNMFIAYVPEGLGNFLTYIAFLAIGVVYLVRSLRSLSVASPYLGTDQFHFLMYLCVVEIAPLLVLTKFLISK